MTIKFVPRVGPFVFYRTPHSAGHRGVLGTIIWLSILFCVMPFIWMCQALWFTAKLLVIGIAGMIATHQRNKLGRQAVVIDVADARTGEPEDYRLVPRDATEVKMGDAGRAAYPSA